MENFLQSVDGLFQQFVTNLPMLLSFLAVFWAVQVLNSVLGGRLNILGIHPRQVLGLIGVVCAPFLHRDWVHLLVNSVMLVMLGMLILFTGKMTFWAVTVVVVVLSGVGIWLFGRNSIHIGASALVMGYFGYLLVQAFYRPSFISILIAAACLYYFGGMFANLFPQNKRVSWEGHVMGFLSGIAAVYLYPFVVSYVLK